jgi:hypothetical protein
MISDTKKMTDRSQYTRAEVCWPVTLTISRRRIKGKTENISQSGGLIYCDKLPPLNGSFWMTIEAPDRPPLRVTAEFVWTTISASDDGSTQVGADVQFLNIGEIERGYLGDIIAKHYQKKVHRTAIKKSEVRKKEDASIGLSWDDSSWSFSC